MLNETALHHNSVHRYARMYVYQVRFNDARICFPKSLARNKQHPHRALSDAKSNHETLNQGFIFAHVQEACEWMSSLVWVSLAHVLLNLSPHKTQLGRRSWHSWCKTKIILNKSRVAEEREKFFWCSFTTFTSESSPARTTTCCCNKWRFHHAQSFLSCPHVTFRMRTLPQKFRIFVRILMLPTKTNKSAEKKHHSALKSLCTVLNAFRIKLTLHHQIVTAAARRTRTSELFVVPVEQMLVRTPAKRSMLQRNSPSTPPPPTTRF